MDVAVTVACLLPLLLCRGTAGVECRDHHCRAHAGLEGMPCPEASPSSSSSSSSPGGVCLRAEDCVAAPRPGRLPREGCEQGLACCPETGVSERKCAEFAALAPAACPALVLPLIVGGAAAGSGAVPHAALLGYGDADAGAGAAAWLCGAALVSERWLLTAAHCVDGYRGPVRWARLGAWLEGRRGEAAAQEVAVAARLRHPQYRHPSRYHDVGLVRLAEAAALGASVRPACLHRAFNAPVDRGQACGYGRVDFDADDSGDALRCVRLPLLKRVECALFYKDDMGSATLPDGLPRNLVCAGDLRGGHDTCQGDSGGPLHFLSDSPHCTFYLLGVTSFGKFCGLPNSPALYARVSHYVPWIESTVWPAEVRAAQAEQAEQTEQAVEQAVEQATPAAKIKES